MCTNRSRSARPGAPGCGDALGPDRDGDIVSVRGDRQAGDEVADIGAQLHRAARRDGPTYRLSVADVPLYLHWSWWAVGNDSVVTKAADFAEDVATSSTGE